MIIKKYWKSKKIKETNEIQISSRLKYSDNTSDNTSDYIIYINNISYENK